MSWSQGSNRLPSETALLRGLNLSDLTDPVAARYNLGLPAIGNTLSVDIVNGDNLLATRGGFPYATVEAAIADALDGDVIWISPGDHTLAAGVVIPAGVTLSGVSHKNTTLQMLLVTDDTILFTMGVRTSIENITLHLTSVGHHTLTGVLSPSTTVSNSTVEGCNIIVDNSSASDVGTSNVYGVHSNGTGFPDAGDHGVLGCFVTVLSAGLGNKRGILADTAAHRLHCARCIVRVERTGVGAGSYIGVESNFAGVELFFQGDWVEGTSAGISQTLGTLDVSPGTYFVSANGLNFSTTTAASKIIWGDNGSIASGTRYMRFGTGTSGTSEPKLTFQSKAVVKDLVIRSITPPGGLRTDTWTVRKNGVDTLLTGSLTGAEVEKIVSTGSVDFSTGDNISLKIVSASSSGTSDVQVTITYV